MEQKFETEKRPIIKAKVNGQDAYFLVDTGASVGLIAEDKVKKFGLAYGRKYPGTLVGQGGEFDAPYFCNTPVEVGDRAMSQFLFADIDDVRYSIHKETGITILGIIGYAQLKMARLTITPDGLVY